MLIIEERPEKSFLVFLLSPALGADLGTHTHLELPHQWTCAQSWREDSCLNGCESILSVKQLISVWLWKVLSEGDSSLFHRLIPCGQIPSCLHLPHTKDSGNSSPHSAWSPPLNIIPWVISLPCRAALPLPFTFTHCFCPIKSELPSVLLCLAVKSAKPETK